MVKFDLFYQQYKNKDPTDYIYKQNIYQLRNGSEIIKILVTLKQN